MNKADIAEKGNELKEQAQEWQEAATEQARKAGEATEQYVRGNTWSSLAIAAGVGGVLGFVLAKVAD